MHVGLGIGEQDLPQEGGVESVYEGLVQWSEESGLRLAGRSRELYFEFHDDNPSANVTELQLPISR